MTAKAVRYDADWRPGGGVSVRRATVALDEPLPPLRLLVPACLPKGRLLALLPQLLRAIARDRDYRAIDDDTQGG